MKEIDIEKKKFSDLIKDVKSIISQARYNSFNAVNAEMLKAYYEIGRKIVEEENVFHIKISK